MSDRINTLFQQRFQGHETPVDDGVWEGIQQQIAATPVADGVNELFKERFQSHETPVDPAVWANISSQLGHSAVAGTTVGTVWGWVAAGAVAVAVTTAALLWEPSPSRSDAIPQVAERPTAEPTSEELPPTRAEESDAPAFTESTDKVLRHTEDHADVTGTGKSPAPYAPRPVEKTPPESNTPSDAPVPTEAGQQGTMVVSGIISGLEEQVRHKPVTADPEPGLAANPEARTMDQEATSLQANGAAALETVILPALPKLFMPNTFTPNGDGINDTYTVDGEGYATILLRVYSMKSNALVFATNNGEPWTGNGCEDGMYMVAVEAHTPDGRTATEGKVVWLSRNRMN